MHDPLTTPSWRIRAAISRSEVPPLEGWRVQYLGKLLNTRIGMNAECQDVEEISFLIESLCTS